VFRSTPDTTASSALVALACSRAARSTSVRLAPAGARLRPLARGDFGARAFVNFVQLSTSTSGSPSSSFGSWSPMGSESRLPSFYGHGR
jgi:hypothetical protein